MDVVESINMARDLSTVIQNEQQKWKWLIIALHSSVQGLMVLNLEKGNGLLTQPPKIAKKMLKAFRNGKDFPDERLDDFLNLYEKTKSPCTHRYNEERAFTASERHDKAMEKLNKLWNEFIHFNPKSWLIEIAIMVDTCLVCLDVIENLAFEANNFLWNWDDEDWDNEMSLKQLKSSVKTIKDSLSKIQIVNQGLIVDINIVNSGFL